MRRCAASWRVDGVLLRCNAALAMCSACNALVAGVSLLAWRVVLHECVCCCTPRSSASNFDAVAASLIKLQLQAFAQQVEPRSRLAAYGCIRCRVVTDAFQVVKPCFSLRTGFGPAANEMANGSGRRHYCASATTICDCYIVKYLLAVSYTHLTLPTILLV